MTGGAPGGAPGGGARRLAGRAALEAAIDPLLDLADFREGARSGRLPSREDPALRAGLLALADDPDRLHAEVIERAGRIVAGHVAERTATGLAVHLLAVGPRSWAGIDPDDYLAALVPVALPPAPSPATAAPPGRPRLRATLSRVRWGIQRWAWHERRMLLYRLPASAARGLAPEPMAVNSIADLLAYEPGSRDGITLRRFLQICFERIEDGRDVFTVADGSLLHSGWLVKRPGRIPLDPHFPIELPRHTAYLSDVFTDPRARGRGLHARSLACRLAAGARHPGIEWLMIAVAPENAVSRRNVERAGMRHYATISARSRLGRERVARFPAS